ncbi:MAG: hypothetical protein KGQ49_04935, partial [Verrucomicrobia bacterium]|nr:hypothetical protein [Verrucomicrobiota bacterium]
MKPFLFAALLLIAPLLAIDVRCDESQARDEVIVDCLQGILFLGNWEGARKYCPEDLHCVMARDVSILQKNPDFLRSVQNEYIGRPLTQQTICDLKAKVAEFYRSKNQPLVVISIPRQDICNGVLQVIVEEARLGQIYVQGNCYFPSRWFSKAMRTCPGDHIDGQTVLEDVGLLNLNPFRRTD